MLKKQNGLNDFFSFRVSVQKKTTFKVEPQLYIYTQWIDNCLAKLSFLEDCVFFYTVPKPKFSRASDTFFIRITIYFLFLLFLLSLCFQDKDHSKIKRKREKKKKKKNVLFRFFFLLPCLGTLSVALFKKLVKKNERKYIYIYIHIYHPCITYICPYLVFFLIFYSF